MSATLTSNPNSSRSTENVSFRAYCHPIVFDGETVKVDAPYDEVDIEVIGTGFHVLAFGGMYVDEPDDAEWYLTIRYYMYFDDTDIIHLVETTYTFLHHCPIIIFTVQNQIHPRAPLEVSYYRMVPSDRHGKCLYRLYRVASPNDGPVVGPNGNIMQHHRMTTTDLYSSNDDEMSSLAQALACCEIAGPPATN